MPPRLVAACNAESTFTVMAPEVDPLDLLGRKPDERLLGEDLNKVPEALGRPEEFRITPARRRIVGFGAAMTGGTLVIGSILTVAALIETISSGFGIDWVIVLVFAIALVATHWGWVHVAELSANRLEARGQQPVLDHRRLWLSEIEPYTRLEVSTRADDDGSITILTTRYRPVIVGKHTFTFERELAAQERHAADEPAAAVTERAESLRREAAVATEEARQHYETARQAYDQALLVADDEAQRRAALHAASEALSERINANLRDPPLTE